MRVRRQGFHVREDVAPLKACERGRAGAFAPSFHVREDVAPLKGYLLRKQAGAGSSFHVREDVAPLKGETCGEWRLYDNLFPRS